MSGRELAERVRAGWPRMRVLFMSGYDREHLAGTGAGLDAAEVVLHKPFKLDELTRRLDEALADHPRS
jgi:DNA-binding response OmpR family regulator